MSEYKIIIKRTSREWDRDDWGKNTPLIRRPDSGFKLWSDGTSAFITDARKKRLSKVIPLSQAERIFRRFVASIEPTRERSTNKEIREAIRDIS